MTYNVFGGTLNLPQSNPLARRGLLPRRRVQELRRVRAWGDWFHGVALDRQNRRHSGDAVPGRDFLASVLSPRWWDVGVVVWDEVQTCI